MKYSRLIFTIILALPVLAQAQKNLAAGKSQLLDKPSLCFVENKGQIKDQYSQPRKDIDFKLESKGVSLFVSKGELSYQFYQSNTVKKTPQTNAPRIPNSQFQIPKKETIHTNRIDVVLEGANEDAEMITEEPQQYYENYILWNLHAVAHSYNKITYKNIYPHIDWVLYIKDNKPEYDFIIHEGGDINDIKIKYKGTDQLALRKDGSLDAICKMGKITELQPYAYEKQTGKTVASNFKLRKHNLSFEVGEHVGDVVIDPSLIWATYYGGTGTDDGFVTIDKTANLYLGGWTTSYSGIATSGSYRGSITGLYSDAFLAKFSSSGSRIWATYYGGDSSEGIHTVSCDDLGDIYLTGGTNSDTGISTSGSFKTTRPCTYSTNAFLAKFSSSGNLLWATYYGGHVGGEGMSVVCDLYNNVYLVGNGRGGGFSDIATPGAYRSYADTTYYANYGFIAKFNAAGTRLWGSFFPAGVWILTTDDTANIYIAGSVNNTDSISTPGSYQSAYGGGAGDAFLAKFNSTGNMKWCTYYGGTGVEYADGIQLDVNNNIFISGATTSAIVMASAGAYQTGYGGGQDAFIAKFSPSGNRIWGSYFGGSGLEAASVCLDNTGGVYLAGTTASTSGIATSSSLYSIYGGGMYDAFFAKFTTRGQFLYSSYYGGSGTEGIATPFCDPNNNLYLGGSTSSTSGITTSSSFQPSFGGGLDDAFIAKFGTDTMVLIDPNFADSFICRPYSFNLNYLVNHAFNAGNVFTVQISDASGSFASPTTIGSLTASGSGYISCSIPSGFALGSYYRIRIAATNPAYVSPDNDFDIRVGTGIPILYAKSNSPVCQGDSLLLIGGSVTGINYSWTGPAGFTSSLQAPIISPFTGLNAGKYHLVGSAPGCASKYDSTIVTVKSSITPSANIGATPSSVASLGTLVNFTANVANCGASPTYQWYKNGVAIPGANTNPFYTDSVVNGDVITVVVKSSDPCTVPDTVVGRLRLSVGQNPLPDNIQLYPNPFTDGITLTNAANSAVMITDVFGRQVYQTTIAKTESFIDLSNLSPGVYFLQLQTGNIISTEKIVKK